MPRKQMTEEEKEAAQGNLLRCMIKKCDASAWVPPICCDFVENQAAITGTCTSARKKFMRR